MSNWRDDVDPIELIVIGGFMLLLVLIGLGILVLCVAAAFGGIG